MKSLALAHCLRLTAYGSLLTAHSGGGCFSSESKNGGTAFGAVSSAIVGQYFLISEYAVRGARPNWVVKMSKVQARQTSVEYSVTVPGGKALRSSSPLFFVVDIQLCARYMIEIRAGLKSLSV